MEQKYTFFTQAVDSFSKNCLSKFGYTQYIDDTWQKNEKRTVLHFSNLEKKIRIHITFSLFHDGRNYINLTMVRDEEGRFGNRKAFFLSTYLEKHSIPNFPFICMPTENLEQFINNYFQNLTTACESYLHDQISGVSFEEHDPAPGRV